ncbi:MAG: cyclic nucleotide-binding domain-containing protein [Calditrichia bacterium]
MNERLQFLKNMALFKNVDESHLEKLLNKMEIRSFMAGENIITEGEQGDSLFFLFQGSVTVNKKLTLLKEAGAENLLDKALIRLKDSDYTFFGEMVLCGEGEVRSATVTAATDCQLGELPADTIRDLIADSNAFAAAFYQNLSTVLADRLRKANRDILKVTTALTLALES